MAKSSKNVPIVLIASVLTLASTFFDSAAVASKSELATHIIQFRSDINPEMESRELLKQGFKVNLIFKRAINGISVDLPMSAVEALSNNPRVLTIERDQEVFALGSEQAASWGLDRIDQRNLPLNGTYSYSDSVTPVDIYVFDTGLNSSLGQFTGRIKSGRNFLTDKSESDTSDCNGHGTHVSGTAMGTTYGVNKVAKVVPIRVLGCTGSGTSTALLSAIDYVIGSHGNEPAVANMSLGFGGIVSAVDTAVANLVADGVVTVVAAGNNGRDACRFTPARVASAVTVGATTRTDSRSSFSNFGACVDVFAPGSDITSVNQNGTPVSWNGTSMASPHVAGVAALTWGLNASLSASDVVNQLIASATPGVVTSAGTGSPNRLLYIAPSSATSYMVTFDYNDAGRTPNSTTQVPQGESINLPVPASRVGFTFDGWFTSLTAGVLVTSPYTPSATATLFGRWTQTASTPSAPLNVSLTSTNRTLVGGWSVPTDSGGALIQSYRVYLYRNGALVTPTYVTATTSWQLGVSPGRYLIQVSAINSANLESPLSLPSQEVRIR